MDKTPSRGTPKRPAESFWNKPLLAVVVTACIGSVVGYYFQLRAWNNENAVTKRQNDSDKAFAVGQKVSEFIDARWAAADQMKDALLKSNANKEDWEHARDKYYRNYEDWQTNLTKWAAQIAFLVDSPFHMLVDDRRKEINPIQCLTYTLDKSSGYDSLSASYLLQIIDHCHDLAKRGIENAQVDRHPVKVAQEVCDSLTRALSETEKQICAFYIRNSHIWWLNNVLRCTVLQRAVTIRNSSAQTWKFMPEATLRYDLGQDARDEQGRNRCIKDYQDDNNRGANALQQSWVRDILVHEVP